MFAQAALLLALIAEELRNGEPFDRLFIGPLGNGDHSSQSRRHFGAQSHRAIALVDEVVELRGDFRAAFGCVEFQLLQWRAVVFAEAVLSWGFAPLGEIVAAQLGA